MAGHHDNFAANLLAQEYEPIGVILDYPERNNGPFMITHFQNHIDEETGTLHNGYHIELQDQSMQWMLTGDSEPYFSAYVVTTHGVMVKIPSGSYNLMKDHATDDAGKEAAGYDDSRRLEPYKVERNAIANDPDRHFKYYLLEFPGDDLNNSLFSPNSENGKLAVDVHPTSKAFTVPLEDGTVQNFFEHRCTIVWDIAIIERVPRYTKTAKPRKNDTLAKLTKNLAGMALKK